VAHLSDTWHSLADRSNIDRKPVQNSSKLTDSCDFCVVSEMRERMEALGVPEAMFSVFDWSVSQILTKLRVKVVLARRHKSGFIALLVICHAAHLGDT